MVIRDCAKKNKLGDPKYASLSASMQIHLKALVGEVYWKKAEDYLCQFLKQQYLKKSPGMGEREASYKAKEMARQAAAPLLSVSVSGGSGSSVGGSTAGSGASTVVHSNKTTGLSPSQHQAMQQRQLHAQQQKQMQELERRKQQDLAKRKKKKEDEKKKEMLRQQQAAKLAAAGGTASAVSTAGGATVVGLQPASVVDSATGAAKGKGGKKTMSRPKAGGVVGTTGKVDALTAATQRASQANAAQIKEYSELMSMLDHATAYDASTAALISGRASAGALNLEEEQKLLLYGSTSGGKSKTAKGLYGSGAPPSSASGASSNVNNSMRKDGPPSLPNHLKGWSNRNLISSRVAWAKLRLTEREEAIRKENNLSTTAMNMSISSKVSPSSSEGKTFSSSNPEWNWFNEETAEEDQALALISEATELYIKTLLEGAINMSRQRMNLDGIRLWHIQQSAAAMNGTETASTSNLLSPGMQSITTPKPALTLRLGCDVSRQHALAQGNAAKVCKRMEEALLRNRNDGNKRRTLDEKLTLNEADSMDALAKVPKLRGAAAKADLNAKRSFEVYGGKDSGNPPLGRIPKQARIMKKDFYACLTDPAFALHKGGITARSFV